MTAREQPGAPGEGPEERALRLVGAELARWLGPEPPGQLWLGDDAACVELGGRPILLTTDAAVAGVHADLSFVGPEDLGWKALSAAVSDVAAMGGVPGFATAAYCLDEGADVAALTAGVGQAAAAHRCPVVGGDLTSADQLVVSVTVVGVPGDHGVVRRRGARPGDLLFVTGPCGAAAAGLRLLRRGGSRTPDEEACVRAQRRPRAKVAEGLAAAAAGASAMIDISDGLALDAHRLAQSSGVGLALEAVPVAPGATWAEALGGGEDYELLVAVPSAAALEERFEEAGVQAPMAVGRLVDDPLRRTVDGEPLAVVGFEHRL